MIFRQSLLKTWQGCSLMAKFAHIDHLPQKTNSKQLFGTHCHSALEHLNRTGNLDESIKVFLDAWAVINPDTWTRGTTYAGLQQKGVEIIKEWHSKQRWEQRRVVGVEHRFLVDMGAHQLEGTVDLLEVKKNHLGKEILRICDHKTSSRKPTQAELYLDLQGTIYIFASLQKEFWLGNGPGFPPIPNGEWWWEMLKDIPRRFIWYHLWTSSEIDGGSRSQVDFDRVYRQLCEIERAIEHEVFIPTISHSSCSFCSYSEGPCPVSVPKREDVRAEEDAWI